MDEEAVLRELRELRQSLAEVLGLVSGLVEVLDRYRELLPEPGTIKARLMGRKVARANAVDHWNGGL